jgi:hypothetical protein
MGPFNLVDFVEEQSAMCHSGANDGANFGLPKAGKPPARCAPRGGHIFHAVVSASLASLGPGLHVFRRYLGRGVATKGRKSRVDVRLSRISAFSVIAAGLDPLP